jgi:type I restriction enzyme M protein
MNRLTSELGELFKNSSELESEIKKQLGAIGYEI